ncbi:SpoIIE family protein phosphatase [Georgenia sp. 10Sc9-8]|uniref:SpoIIE family protein phosphatase n=1 Tax=Georgenia halotolerans TaxID=3028317 RepID=A0ABT5TYD3_9MICO|nr:SpoIIE family protein phosphatase [Georgenia halotolerans]
MAISPTADGEDGARGVTVPEGPPAHDSWPTVPEGAPPAWAEAVLATIGESVALVRWSPHERSPMEVLWVNDAAEGLTGYTRAELLTGGAAPLAGVIADDDVPMELRVQLREGNPGGTVVRLYRADGEGYWANVALTPYPTASDEVPWWVLVTRDVSGEVASAAEDRLRFEADERARLGLSVVLRVSGLLSELDGARVLGAITDLLTRRVVAWCGFFARGRGLYELDAITTRTEQAPRRLEDLPSCAISELFAGSSMRTVTLDPAVTYSPGSLSAELLDLVRPQLELHPDSPQQFTVLPVLGRRGALAVLVALARPARQHRPEPAGGAGILPSRPQPVVRGMAEQDVGTVLELVARRVGMAMENAQLYAREHSLAETLQLAMLPEQDDVGRLDVWSYYAPTSEHAQVGGDWYDVVNLSESTVAVVVGDVVGHDVEAAAAMGQLRSVVRAYAAEFIDPGTVLERVDRLVSSMRVPRSASLVYATLTPRDDGSWDVAYHRAGHLPALLVRDGQVTSLSDAGGTLIGFSSRPRQTGFVRVDPGDVLIFYTDGLVERRDRPMREGVTALEEVCSHIHAPDAAGVGEEILQLADAPEDDIALVVVRVPGQRPGTSPPGSSPRQRRWQLPPDPATIGRARRAVARACEAWGIAEAPAAELVTSELTANAVMHGWGRVGLQLQDTGDGLRIEVEDANPAPPVPREHMAGRVGGFGIHIVDRLADWGWRPTPSGKVVWARLRRGAGTEIGSRPAPGRPSA